MKNKINILYWYSLLTFLTLVLFCLIYKTWQIPLNIPFEYKTGDGYSVLASYKGMKENGWIYENKLLSAPFGQISLDYPSCDLFLLSIIKILLLTTQNIFLTYNLFFILTFLLASYTSFFVLRKYKISKLNSLAGSLLFSFSTYHLYRSQQHLFLSAYFLIPILIDLVLENFKKITDKDTVKNKAYKLISLILLSSTGIYYAFYSCLLLLFSGLISSIKYKQFKKILTTFLMVGIIFIGVLINFTPNLIYQYKNGKNSITAQREPIESDYYGLRIIELFIPPSGYNIENIEKIGNIYKMNRLAIMSSAEAEYLGIIGIIGFLSLLTLIFFYKKESDIRNCSNLLIMALLYGIVSGFGTIFSYIVTPEIRANNRISIIISFICLLGLLLIIEKNSKKFLNTQIKKYFCFIILLCGLIDQTVWKKPNNLETQKEFLSDQRFVQKIEEKIPENSKVYQLPYKQYPETPYINKIGDYDLFRPYINSSTTSWSYGAIKGRLGDFWNQENINLSTNELINKLIISDFNGIYIDRFGYLDNGEKIENEIEKITSEKPIISDNQRFSFFNLSNYQKTYLKDFSIEEINKLKEKYLYPTSITFNGCYGLEKNQNNSWYWCQKTGDINIHNYSNNDKLIKLEFDLNKNVDSSKITFFKKENNEILKIISSKIPNHYFININLRPGQNKISFKTNLNQIMAQEDSRVLYFQIFNLKTNTNSSEN